MDKIEGIKRELIDLHMNHVNENRGYIKQFEAKVSEFADLLSSEYKNKEKAQKEMLLFLTNLTTQTDKLLNT